MVALNHQDEASAVMQMNMLLAICMIYLVMAALFESLLLPTAVITSLFFSFTGGFLGIFYYWHSHVGYGYDWNAYPNGYCG